MMWKLEPKELKEITSGASETQGDYVEVAKAQRKKIANGLRERAEIFKKSAKEADNYSLANNSHEATIRSVYLEKLASTYEKELQG